MPAYVTDPDLLAQLEGSAPTEKPKTRTPEDFAKTYGPAAERAAKTLGVDPKMLLGQWGLETGWGKSIIPGTNNLGNIKDLAGGGVAATDNMTGSRDKYRTYASPDAFADDYASLIQRKYPRAAGAKDPLAFATALQAGGYAEDPRYVDKVVQATRMAGTSTNPILGAVGRAVGAVVPSAQAAERGAAPAPPGRQYVSDPALLAQLEGKPPPEQAPTDDISGVPRAEVRGTSAGEPPAEPISRGEPPAEPISRGERVMQGVLDPIAGGAQLLTKALPGPVVQAGNQLNNWLADKTGLVGRLPEGGVDQQVREREAEYEARRRAGAGGADPGFDAYRTIGNVVSPANLALAARAPVAVTALGRAGAAAGVGAASGAAAPVTTGAEGDYLTEKAKQVGIGAAGGGIGERIAAGVGRLISPNASTNPLVALMQREGVRPTVGQAAGGWANTLEQRLTSVPVLGDMIAGARTSAQDDLRRAAQNRVTDPLNRAAVTGQPPAGAFRAGTPTAGIRAVGQPVPGGAPAVPAGRVAETGFEGTRQVTQAVDDAYDAARNAMGSFRLDGQAQQELQTIRQMVGQLDQREQSAFLRTWREIQQDISPNGTIPASVFKRVDSKIGKDAADFSKSQDPYQRQLGDALSELQRTIQGAGRRANPQAAELFDQADTAFANLVRVQDAAKRAVNQEGRFTPGQLNQAVRAGDQSVRRNTAAQGDALMQDLSNAGQQVLGNTVPDSGTAGRTFAGLATLASGAINPLIPIGIASGSMLYTQPAQSALRALLLSRPGGAPAVRNSLMQLSPGLGLASGQIGLNASK